MQVLRVLVMEDDFVIGTLLAEMLQELGHEVGAIEATVHDAVSDRRSVQAGPDDRR
jgi:two-component system, response regulator PdtaR